MYESIKGKVALVCGAGSVGDGVGNGRAISILLARSGAKVMAVDRNEAAAEATRGQIVEEGGICETFCADVTKAAEVKSMVDACIQKFGRVDILINNVGTAEVGGPVELSEEAWDRIFDINVKSMFLSCKYVLPIMESNGGGAIVNISSIASIRWAGVPYVAYGASKSAVNGFTRYVGLQYAAKNIRVNAVLPGLINTPMIVEPLVKHYGNDLTGLIAMRDAMCPTGSMGTAWDVANATVFLASDEAKYINGTEMAVDGGISQQVLAPAARS